MCKKLVKLLAVAFTMVVVSGYAQCPNGACQMRDVYYPQPQEQYYSPSCPSCQPGPYYPEQTYPSYPQFQSYPSYPQGCPSCPRR